MPSLPSRSMISVLTWSATQVAATSVPASSLRTYGAAVAVSIRSSDAWAIVAERVEPTPKICQVSSFQSSDHTSASPRSRVGSAQKAPTTPTTA